MKTISERLYNRDQSWYFERIVRKDVRSAPLKVDIRRNAYDNQSGARVWRWNGSEWKLVVDAPISDCVCRSVRYTNDASVSDFECDFDRLLNEALEIIEEA